MTFPEIASTVQEIVAADINVLKPIQVDNFIRDALDLFSNKFPREVVKDVTGDGTQEYATPSDSGLVWDITFSTVKSIEYPTGNVPPTYLDEGIDNDYILYQTNSSTFIIKFLSVTPNSSETFRLTYTIPWAESAVDSIPTTRQRAFNYLVAVLCCEYLARYYSKASESTMSADVLVFKNKSDEYARRAKELQARFDTLIGIEQSASLKPTSAIGDWDLMSSRGADMLTHPKVYR